MKKLLVLILLLITLVGTAWAYNCQICGGHMYATGNVLMESGKLLKEYSCYSGHTWWIVE